MDKLVEYLCVIQARVNSSRLPSKVMLDLGGKILLQRVYETISKSKRINKIVVATSNEKTDDILDLKLSALKIECFRGSLNNVLERFYFTAKKYEAKNIIRITADNPLMDGVLLDELISLYETSDCSYSMFANAVYGLSAEVFSFKALENAYKFARNDFDKEHVTPYIKDCEKTCIVNVAEKYRKPDMRATIDTLDDYIRMQKFYLYCNANNLETNIDNFILLEASSNV